MKKMIGTVAVVAALAAAPAFAGGLNTPVESAPITAPEDMMVPMGSMGSAGGVLPMLLVLGLLAAATSGS